MKLNVLLVSDQVRGIDGTGGLGDVAAGLAKELARRDDMDIRILMPGYRNVGAVAGKNPFQDVVTDHLPVLLGSRTVSVKVCRCRLPKFSPEDQDVTCYLACEPEIFHRRENSGVQAILLAQATLSFLRNTQEFRPDVIHCNDWHAALIPVYLNTVDRTDPYLGRIATVYTTHNNSRDVYQGAHEFHTVQHLAGLDDACYRPGVTRSLEHHGRFNFAKGGLAFADLISTVSDRYAHELRTRAFGGQLETVLAERAQDLFGIVNGIDTHEWDPQSDPFLPPSCRFSKADPVDVIRERKIGVREELRRWRPDDSAPCPFADLQDDFSLMGVVTRITDQKMPVMLPLREDTGWDYELISPLERLCRDNPRLQIVFLGNAERNDWRGNRYADGLRHLQRLFPQQLLFFDGFDIRLSHLIFAAAEFFLMPSVFEPCGLTQLTGMRYGTVPIVRAVGGLLDTVIDESESQNGNGFTFLESRDPVESWHGMVDVPRAVDQFHQTVRRALATKKNPERWYELIENGMARDSSWAVPASQYRKLYDAAVRQRMEACFSVSRSLGSVQERFRQSVKHLEHLFTVSAPIHFNLQKIGTGAFGPFEMTEVFRSELGQLRDLGYIEADGLDRIPRRGDELSRHVRITDPGREFVRLRSALS